MAEEEKSQEELEAQEAEQKVEKEAQEKLDKETVENEAVEERARIMGHLPKKEFKGDPERWISAKEYVERADTMMPILKATNAKLEKKFLDLEKELETQKELSKKMVKIHGKYSEDFYDGQISDIKARKLKAVEDNDVDLFKKLEDEESKIVKPETLETPEEDTKEKDHPEVAKWKEENSSWYGVDVELTEYADIIADRMAKSGHSYKEYDFCKAVKAKVKKMFPDKFKNPNAEKGSGVDEGDTRGGGEIKSEKKTWNDLDKDAKAQCAELIATIPKYTKEKYLKEYFSEEE